MDWHGRGTAAENSDEVILEGLDGFFSHVALVLFRGDKFVGHAGGLNGGLVLHRCLVVKDLMFGDDPAALHPG